MWVTIYVAPDSQFNLKLPQLFDSLGFRFDGERIGLVHEDGTFVEYAPGPAPPG